MVDFMPTEDESKMDNLIWGIRKSKHIFGSLKDYANQYLTKEGKAQATQQAKEVHNAQLIANLKAEIAEKERIASQYDEYKALLARKKELEEKEKKLAEAHA